MTTIAPQLCQHFLSTAVVQPALLCATQSCFRHNAESTTGLQETAHSICSDLMEDVFKAPASCLAMTYCNVKAIIIIMVQSWHAYAFFRIVIIYCNFEIESDTKNRFGCPGKRPWNFSAKKATDNIWQRTTIVVLCPTHLMFSILFWGRGGLLFFLLFGDIVHYPSVFWKGNL